MADSRWSSGVRVRTFLVILAVPLDGVDHSGEKDGRSDISSDWPQLVFRRICPLRRRKSKARKKASAVPGRQICCGYFLMELTIEARIKPRFAKKSNAEAVWQIRLYLISGISEHPGGKKNVCETNERSSSSADSGGFERPSRQKNQC